MSDITYCGITYCGKTDCKHTECERNTRRILQERVDEIVPHAEFPECEYWREE